MKITDLAREPQLIAIRLDDKDLVEEFGEAIEFWTWDRFPIETFLKLAQAEENQSQIFEIVRTLVLDESGKPVLTGSAVLPAKVMMRVVTKVVESLGKF